MHALVLHYLRSKLHRSVSSVVPEHASGGTLRTPHMQCTHQAYKGSRTNTPRSIPVFSNTQYHSRSTHIGDACKCSPEIWPYRLCVEQLDGVRLSRCTNSSDNAQCSHGPVGGCCQAGQQGSSHQCVGEEQGLAPSPAVTQEAKQASANQTAHEEQLQAAQAGSMW